MGKVEAMKFTRPGDQTCEWTFHETNWDAIELRAVPLALYGRPCRPPRTGPA